MCVCCRAGRCCSTSKCRGARARLPAPGPAPPLRQSRAPPGRVWGGVLCAQHLTYRFGATTLSAFCALVTLRADRRRVRRTSRRSCRTKWYAGQSQGTSSSGLARLSYPMVPMGHLQLKLEHLSCQLNDRRAYGCAMVSWRGSLARPLVDSFSQPDGPVCVQVSMGPGRISRRPQPAR